MDKLKISISENAGCLFFIAILLIRSNVDCFGVQTDLGMETREYSWSRSPFLGSSRCGCNPLKSHLFRTVNGYI